MWKAPKLTTFWRHGSRFWTIWDFTFSDQGCWNGEVYTNIHKARNIQNTKQVSYLYLNPCAQHNITKPSAHLSACLPFLPTQWIVLCLCQQNTKQSPHLCQTNEQKAHTNTPCKMIKPNIHISILEVRMQMHWEVTPVVGSGGRPCLLIPRHSQQLTLLRVTVRNLIAH